MFIALKALISRAATAFISSVATIGIILPERVYEIVKSSRGDNLPLSEIERKVGATISESFAQMPVSSDGVSWLDFFSNLGKPLGKMLYGAGEAFSISFLSALGSYGGLFFIFLGSLASLGSIYGVYYLMYNNIFSNQKLDLEKTSRQINSIEEKVENVEEKVDTVSAQLVTNTEKVDNVLTQLVAVEEKVENASTQLDTVSAQLVTNTEQVDNVSQRVNELSQQVLTIEKTVSSNTDLHLAINDRIKELEGGFKTLQKNQMDILMDNANIKVDIANVSTQLNEGFDNLLKEVGSVGKLVITTNESVAELSTKMDTFSESVTGEFNVLSGSIDLLSTDLRGFVESASGLITKFSEMNRQVSINPFQRFSDAEAPDVVSTYASAGTTPPLSPTLSRVNDQSLVDADIEVRTVAVRGMGVEQTGSSYNPLAAVLNKGTSL